jgi:hypothetical protein
VVSQTKIEFVYKKLNILLRILRYFNMFQLEPSPSSLQFNNNDLIARNILSLFFGTRSGKAWHSGLLHDKDNFNTFPT